ncbi:MAG: hypothetical protein ACK5TP_01205 [bacterium]
MPTRPTLLLTSAVFVALACAGCANNFWYPGGPLASRDQFTYISTPDYPQTISVIDTRIDQVIWTAEVPVDKQLVIRFYKDEGLPNTATPDKMVWDIWPAGQTSGDPQFTFNAPPSNARRVDVTLRPTPEFPAHMKPAGVPMPNLPFPEPTANAGK